MLNFQLLFLHYSKGNLLRERIDNYDVTNKAIDTMEVKQSKRFVIRKSLIGKGVVIEFTDHSGKVWKYDHDKVYELNKERLEALPSWHKYKCYTQTYNMPKYIRAQADKVLVE